MPTGLEYQLVDVRFNEGLDTKTQPKVRLPGKWEILDNCTLSDKGTPQKRNGVSPLVDGGAGALGNGLATNGSELLVVNGSAVSSLSTASSPDTLVTVPGQLANIYLEKSEVYRTTGYQDSHDCATGAGYTCYIWREKDAAGNVLGIQMMLVDEATKAEVIPSTRLISSAGAYAPRTVFSSDRFYLLYLDVTAGPALFGRVVETATPTGISAQSTIITSAALSQVYFDAAPDDANSAVIAYGWADGVTTVRTALVNGSLVGPPTIVAGPLNIISNAQLATANLTGVACSKRPGSSLAGIFTIGRGATAMSGMAGVVINVATFAVATAATQLDAAAPAVAGLNHITACSITGGWRVFSDRQSTNNTGPLGVSPIRAVTTSTALVVTVAAATLCNSANFTVNATQPSGPQGPWIFGKAFQVNGSVYLPCCILENYTGLNANTNNNNTQNGAYILDGATGQVLARALYGTFGIADLGGVGPTAWAPCSSPEISAGNFVVLAPEYTDLLVINGGINVSPVGISRFDMRPNFAVPPIRAQLGESTYFAGGALSIYDGSRVVEASFFMFPEGVSCVAGGGGTGTMTAGVHQVVVVYEWIDSGGNKHQSAPSPAVAVTVVATGSIALRIPTLLLTQKPNIILVPYVTLAGGLTFHRCDLTGGTYAPVVNSKAVAELAFTVAASDAVLASGELLYTQPNQAGTTLANISPGPSTALAIHQNRLFLDASDQPGVVAFSQALVRDTGLQFSDELSFTLDVNGGDFVGLASMDEKLDIFCERKPYVLLGSGPTAAGLNSQYSDPIEVPSDVGCSEARSILKMPMGVMFKSPKGWYLLSRDLTAKYIGDGVQAYNANSVSSAVMLENQQECRFGSLSGRVLVYSYLDNQWSTFTQNSMAIRDSIWWPTAARWVCVSEPAGLMQENPGVLYDEINGNNEPIVISMRTGWLRVNSIEGFQRVRWLYLTMTSNTVPVNTPNFTIEVDYDDQYGQAAPGSYFIAIDMSAITFSSAQAIDLRTKLRRQKCKSVAFTFTENPNATDSQLTGLQALALQIGVKRGTNKLPAAQSVG